jgi:acetoin utilization deacetylase AcuC-like enzyme
MSAVLVFDDPAMEPHDPGPGHPERPDRLRAARAGLTSHPAVSWRTPQPATAADLGAVHDPEYVARVLALRGRRGMLDEDTYVSERSIDAALLAAGAVRDAVDAVIHGPAPRAVALVRPPGHHAERAAAMGFCLFNNIAVGARRALDRGVERILIVDWDVHHGNGTEHWARGMHQVTFFSTHQGYGFYPGTGNRSDGNIVNRPLHAGAGHRELVDAFVTELVPRADELRPELVLVSAGFDAHADDPLGELLATDETYAELTGIVAGIADRHAGGRLVAALEGGYDLGALERSVRAMVEVLAR